MLASSGTNLTNRERAEVQRSRVQASLTKGPARTAASVVARYANPPADTPHELEYAYYLLGDIRGRTVLDVGCGDGQNTTLLAGKGARVYALDLSPDLLTRAAARLAADGHAGAVTFLCGSAHAIPLPDGSVDIVFGNAVLHHVDLALAREEIFRVLRSGGRAIFKEPTRESRVLRAARPLIPYHAADVSPYERPLFRSEIEQFAGRFVRGRLREFRLPIVTVAKRLHAPKAVQERTRRIDARLLAQHRWLRRYAGVAVFEVFKPGASAS